MQIKYMGSFLQHAPFKLLQENKEELNQEMLKAEKIKKSQNEEGKQSLDYSRNIGEESIL